MSRTAPLRTLADEDLLQAFRGGSTDAFDELFRRYERPIWGYFRRRVVEAARAEELTQDTFLALMKGAGRWEPRATLRTYLYGIAFNLLCAERRRQRVLVPIAPEGAAVTPSIDETIWIRRAIASLDPAEREVLMLREFEALSYAEIAVALELPLNTVRSRLFRAREALRLRLRPETVAKGRVS